MKLRNLMLVLAAAASLAAQTGGNGVMLERAIRKESVEGDLKGAIELYKKVVAGAAKDRTAAAKALLRLGECYEKQGNAEAQRAYQRLVSEFSDQKDQARDAQVRLAALGQPAGGSKAMVAQLIAKGVSFQRGSRVTPDGRLYVFADPATGDLAVRDLQTGVVRCLTNQAGRGPYGTYGAREPVPSRDGKQIAYHWVQDSPGGLRVINVDGSGMRIVPFEEDGYTYPLDWSPDQKSILVTGRFLESTPGTRSFWSGLATIDLGTGAVKRLGVTQSPESAGFSPDGRWVVYSRRLEPGNPDWDIFAVDTRSGKETAVVKGAGQDRYPMWLPDSDRIVFRSDRTGKNAVWTVRFQDGEAAGAPVLIKPEAGDYSPLGIGNDGSLFYGLAHVARDVYQATVDPQTLRVQEAPSRLVETYLGRNSRPAWSPAGNSFAYYSERDINKSSRLVVHHPDGKETVVAEPVNELDYLFYWCGNGEQVASWGWPAPRQIRLFDSQTGLAAPPVLNVVTPPAPWQLGAAPDCQSVYISSYSQATKQRRIYRYEFSTSKETNLITEVGGWARNPTVSPDGRWLALLGRLDGRGGPGILVLSTAGGTPRVLDPEGWDSTWTPESKRLMYVRSVKRSDGQATENELYWVPVEGGTPQSMGIRMPGASAPSLNIDGRRILFSATETSNDLWVLRNWR